MKEANEQMFDKQMFAGLCRAIGTRRCSVIAPALLVSPVDHPSLMLLYYGFLQR